MPVDIGTLRRSRLPCRFNVNINININPGRYARKAATVQNLSSESGIVAYKRLFWNSKFESGSDVNLKFKAYNMLQNQRTFCQDSF